jgi:heterodisulfide reductase subunit D
MNRVFEEIVESTKAYYCLECGICTGSCPVSRHHEAFSPRLMVERALLTGDEADLRERDVWSCLTCGTCSARCPATVDYSEFTRRMRVAARGADGEGVDTHAGVLAAMMELQARRACERDLSWISPDLRVAKRGKLLFFTGCLPHLNIVFGDMGVDTVAMANSAIRLMNACGRRPVVSPDERCCGHDLYWTGELESFRKLARMNLRMIEKLGATTVVFACPECCAMFAQVYPKLFGKLDFEVAHVTEFLAPRVAQGRLSFAERDSVVTYQDPCRLGRYLGVYDAPRRLLAAVPGLDLREMPRTRSEAVCCGSSSWVGCTRVNKSIQLERLREAAATGAATLVTACPKCNIHLACAARDGDLDEDIEIRFVTDLLSDALVG